MDENEKRERIALQIGRYVGKKNIPKVVNWAIRTDCQFQGNGQDAIRAIQAYEAATDQRVYWPENADLVRTYIATERFGFKTALALDARDARLYETITDACEELREWRNGKLCMTEFDERYTVARAGNLVYKQIEEKLTPAQKGYKAEAYKAAHKLWDQAELIAAIVSWLRENRTGEWSQNEIASALEADSRYVFRLLEQITEDKSQGVITYKAKRKQGDPREGKRQVYKYAPERVKLLAAPDRDAYIARLIAYVLREKPCVSRFQVYTTLHTYLGQIENRVVYRVLDSMIAAGKVVSEPSKYDNAKLCRLA